MKPCFPLMCSANRLQLSRSALRLQFVLGVLLSLFNANGLLAQTTNVPAGDSSPAAPADRIRVVVFDGQGVGRSVTELLQDLEGAAGASDGRDER